MLAKGLTGHKSQGLGLRPYMIHADRAATEELGWYFTVLTRLITKPSDTELDLAIIDGPCPPRARSAPLPPRWLVSSWMRWLNCEHASTQPQTVRDVCSRSFEELAKLRNHAFFQDRRRFEEVGGGYQLPAPTYLVGRTA